VRRGAFERGKGVVLEGAFLSFKNSLRSALALERRRRPPSGKSKRSGEMISEQAWDLRT